MRVSTDLGTLYETVKRQTREKRDMIVDTNVGVRMVDVPKLADGNDAAGRARLVIETLPSGAAALERFRINDTAHRQMADWLGIPWKYYDRLCSDHPDLVVTQVNALFEREPGRRMLRTLDGKVRAFLSDRYRRIDNDIILANTLPAIMDRDNFPANRVLRPYIGDDSMSLSVVFTDPALTQVIGKTHNGGDDSVNPGFQIENSETGKGRFRIRGFFHRGYCDNGCVWTFGDIDIELVRNHIGGKLASDAMGEILSDEARKADDQALMLAARDVLKVMAKPEMAQKLGDALRAAKAGAKIENVPAATELLVNDLGLLDAEKDAFLSNLIREADLSRYGALNAVTAIANAEETSQERAFELEEIGGKVLAMANDQWLKYAVAGREKVKIAA